MQGQPSLQLSSGVSLFLDLDGCLADFDRGFPEMFGYHHSSVSEDEMWSTIAGHPDFFGSLKTMDGAMDFFAALRHLSPTILTACPKNMFERADEQKRRWVAKWLGDDIPVITVQGGKNKPRHMRAPGDVLVDDWSKNVRAWREAGGVAVQFERAAQALDDLRALFPQHIPDVSPAACTIRKI